MSAEVEEPVAVAASPEPTTAPAREGRVSPRKISKKNVLKSGQTNGKKWPKKQTFLFMTFTTVVYGKMIGIDVKLIFSYFSDARPNEHSFTIAP